jgi:hypothetical protein
MGSPPLVALRAKSVEGGRDDDVIERLFFIEGDVRELQGSEPFAVAGTER